MKVFLGRATVSCVSFILILFLISCGGGGGSQSNGVTTPPSLDQDPSASVILSPNTATVNATVNITGTKTAFVQGSTTANFGPGTSVGGGSLGQAGQVTVVDATHATAQVSFGTSPFPSSRPRLVAVQTGTHVSYATFTVGSAPGTAPIAIAGNQQAVKKGDVVHLDGSGSLSLSGSALTYAWSLTTKPTGSTAALSSASVVNPTFTADADGSYVAQLVVNDGTNSTADWVTISTTTAAPVANAGNPQLVAAGSTVQLDGSGSTDPNGNPITYSWKIAAVPTGSSASTSLVGPSLVNPTFKADLPGIYIAELTVNDGLGNNSTSTVTIGTVSAYPTSVAGVAKKVTAGSTVTLDGSGSLKPNGSALNYSWILVFKPAGSSATLTNPLTANPTFVADVNGTYIAQLTVTSTNSSDQSASDPAPKAISTTSTNSISTVLITTDNVPPVAIAGPSQKIATGSTVNLDGSQSAGTGLKYSWSLLSKPAGSTASLAAATTAKPSFTADIGGAYVAQLIVTDSSNFVGAPSTVLIIATVPAIQISPTSLTFPDQTQGTTSASQPLTVTNTGNGDLSITGVTFGGANGGDFKATTASLPITVAPGSSTTINVTFAPTGNGARAGTLSIASNATVPAAAVTLSGNGTVPTVNITPSPAVFTAGQPVNTTSSALAITISNPGAGTLTITNLALTGANPSDFNFSSGSLPITVLANGSTVVNVTFTPTAVGARSATLTITDTAAGSPHSVNLSGTGTAPGISLNPTTLGFGNQLLGQTTSASPVVVTNNGGAALTISSISLTGTNVSDFHITSGTSNITVQPNASTTINITFAPGALGARSAVLNIAHNANGIASPLTLAISGTGVVPTLTGSPLDFGTQTVNIASTAKPVTITNPSAGVLTISGVTITGTNASEFTMPAVATPINVAAGGSQTFNITFTPTAVGSRTATLTITDNASGSPRAVVLSGTGAVPGFSSSPSPFDFGNQTVNQASGTKVMTITNPGAGNLILSAAAVAGTNASDFSLTTPISSPITIAPNGTQTLSFTFTPGAAGARSATLSVTDNAGNHSIPILGNGATPTVGFAPSPVAFGNQAVGTPATLPLVVSNTGLGSLMITNIQAAGTNASDFTFTAGTLPITVAPGGNTTINVTFTPAATGARTASLSISDNANGSPQSVSLTGTGTAPAISFNPSPLIFANTALGSTSAATGVTITNSGTGPLVINGLSVAGANASDFTLTPVTTPITVAANGGTTTLSLTFTPGAAGGRSATLQVTDNATGSPHSLALQGTGTIPGIGAPGTVNFGNQLVGSSSSPNQITVQNTGQANLVISAISIAGGNAGDFGFTSGTLPITVTPNNTTVLTATFTPAAGGVRSTTLTFTYNGGTFPITLTGTGTAPAVTLAPPSLTFGNQLQNTTSAAQSVTLTNSGTAPLNVTGVSASANYSQTSNCVGQVAAGASCTINVSFTPTTTGALSGSITITDSATGSPHVVGLTGTGTLPGISATPNPLPFAGQLLNTTSVAGQVVVKNTGTADLVISSLSIFGTNASEFSLATVTTPLTITPGNQISLNITFTPTALGARTATLSISDNVAGSPHSVTLNGTGTSPIYNASPGTLTFNGQLVGTTSASQPVTISNNGTGPLTISNIAASGDFAQTNTCPNSLAPSTNCVVTVTFTPTATGTRTGLITVTDSATGSPHTIGLTGTGTAPAVGFTPASGINFGNQGLGSTSGAQTIAVNNTGSGPLTISGISITGTNSGDFTLTPVTTPITVQAGNSVSLSITFTPGAKGARSATINITDNASGSPHSANLIGTGIGIPIANVTPTINFGNIAAGTTSPNSIITISNPGTDDLIVTSVAKGGANPADFSVATAGFTVPAGQSVNLNVTFTPSTSGSRSATVVFTDNANNVGGSTQSVALNGTGTAAIASLDFGTLSFAPTLANTTNPAPQTVTLTNTGNGPLTITSVTVTGTSASEFSAPAVTPKTLQPGQTFPVTVTFQPNSSGTRTATLTFNDNAFNNPQQQVSLTGIGTAVGTLNAPGVTVGSNLEAQITPQISPTQSSDTTVTITSSDPSVALLSTDPATAGSASVQVTISAGFPFTITPVYVQAVGASGTSTTLIETAPGFNAGFATVTVVPAGFVLTTPGGLGTDFTATTTGGAQQLLVQAARLDTPGSPLLNVKVRGGLTVNVPVNSGNTSAATISTSPVAITGGQTTGTTNLIPVAPGTSSISIGVPSGFTDPGTNKSATATITSPSLALGAVTVGVNLQTNVHVNLGSPAPAGGLIVTISTSDQNKAILATNPANAGLGTIQLVVPQNSSQTADFYVQGLALADVNSGLQITASASGYGTTSAGIQVTPSGFTIRSGSVTLPGTSFSSTTQSGDTTLTIEPYRLDTTLAWVTSANQGIRGGLTVNVQVTSSNTSVGIINMSPATFTANQKSATVTFTSLGQGTSTITAVTPNNFFTPTTGAQLTATVTSPQVSLQFSSNPSNVVGAGLQAVGSGSLNTAAPSPGLNVFITSSDPSTILLSNSPNTAGSSSIIVPILPGQGLNGAGFPVFYMQALKKSASSVTLTATASGFGSATMQVTAVGSGFVISGPNGIGQDFGASISHGTTAMDIVAIPLDATGAQAGQAQGIAGGTTATVLLNTSTPGVGDFNGVTSVTFVSGTGGNNGNGSDVPVNFRPLTTGSTVLSVTQPGSPFTAPTTGTSLNASVVP